MTDSFRPNKWIPHPPKHIAAKDPILYRWLLDFYNYTWQIWFPKQRAIGAGLVYDDENRVSVDALISPPGQPVVTGGSDESPEQGPPGPPGRDGAKGDVGPPGPPGEDGQDGSPGAQGATGAAGATGAKGDAGVTGATGATGATGPAGADGAKGAAGADGATGATGATGPPGIGADGDPGDMGPPGTVGPMGPQGPMGPPGSDGDQGDQGPPGPMGGTYIQIPLYYETKTALAGTPSGAFEAGIGQSTAFGMRFSVPTGYKLLIVAISAGWDTGAGAGTWSIDVIARVSGANTTLMTITTSSASSSGNQADVRSMASPFATYDAGSLVAVGFSNRATSPGPMGTAFKRAYVGCILVPAI